MSFDFRRRIFDHVQLGVADRAEIQRFYRTVLAPLGIPVVSETDDWIMFAHLAIGDDRPVSTNVHLSFQAASPERVDAVPPRRRRSRVPRQRGAGPAL